MLFANPFRNILHPATSSLHTHCLLLPLPTGLAFVEEEEEEITSFQPHQAD